MNNIAMDTNTKYGNIKAILKKKFSDLVAYYFSLTSEFTSVFAQFAQELQ